MSNSEAILINDCVMSPCMPCAMTLGMFLPGSTDTWLVCVCRGKALTLALHWNLILGIKFQCRILILGIKFQCRNLTEDQETTTANCK